MITEGRFKAQLAKIERILTKLVLLDERQANPNKSLGAAHFRGMTYRQVYEECTREFAYDFRLSDQSLLLFIKGGRDVHDGELSFCYYESPVNVMPSAEFVASQLGIASEDDSFAETLAARGDELRKPDQVERAYPSNSDRGGRMSNVETCLAFDTAGTIR